MKSDQEEIININPKDKETLYDSVYQSEERDG